MMFIMEFVSALWVGTWMCPGVLARLLYQGLLATPLVALSVPQIRVLAGSLWRLPDSATCSRILHPCGMLAMHTAPAAAQAAPPAAAAGVPASLSPGAMS